MQNNSARAAKSSVKELANEKSYRISVSTGIFEHCPDMLASVWLFLWYIDRTTKESNGEGTVLGGMPIIDSKPTSTLRMPVKTIRRWRLHLKKKGYIRTVRTPYGYVITLLKSKKWNWGPALVGKEKESPKRDLPNGEVSPIEIPHSGKRDLPFRAERVPISGTEISPNGKYKEDKAVQDRDRAVETAPSAATLLSKTKQGPEWKAIGIHFPVGGATFKASWRAWYVENGSAADSLVWLMEEFIQKCQTQGVAVPPPFFAAKRKLEREEEGQGDRSADATRRPAVQL
jgi:hypothetical protein